MYEEIWSLEISCMMIRPILNVWMMAWALRLNLCLLWSIAFKSASGPEYFHFNLGKMSDQTKIVDGKVREICFRSRLMILSIFCIDVLKTLLPSKWITIIKGFRCKITHCSFCLKSSQVMVHIWERPINITDCRMVSLTGLDLFCCSTFEHKS